MTTTPDRTATRNDAHPALRPFILGAAILDTVGGVLCLALADRLADWLAIGTGTVEITGAVFLLAAVTGIVTLRRRLDVRWIMEANVVFAVWCIAVIAFDSPNGIGIALLAVSAAAATATALVERRLS
jgi:hypothetical protein